ncbi:type VI secretion system-associated protein TagF [Pseudoalteromonas fenneropenaei]|uniref:Type VI secretion system-associated protein TagF n=1 Tax=Pseudoalteromonas fenneropenaei TaxID=1737459 RepID=A0ABV7CHZ7_9GAMM
MFGLFNKKKTQPIKKQDYFGFFGKHAIQADFIKHQVNSRESIALDHWVQEGIAAVGRMQRDDKVELGRKSLFIIAGGPEESALVGVISASRDNIGRNYPFVNFVFASSADYKTHPAFLFLLESYSLQNISAVHERLLQSSSKTVMESVLSEQELVARQLMHCGDVSDAIAQLRKMPMLQIWQALQYQDIEARARLIGELASILKAVANRGCLRTQFGIRLPMPTDWQAAMLVGGFWLNLITNAVADHNWQPWVFYQFGHEELPASMVVFCRPVPASYFDAIYLPEQQGTSAIDLTQLKLSLPVTKAAMDLAIADNMSIFDALRSWSKV